MAVGVLDQSSNSFLGAGSSAGCVAIRQDEKDIHIGRSVKRGFSGIPATFGRISSTGVCLTRGRRFCLCVE